MRAAPLQLDFRQRPSSRWRWAGWVLLGLAVLAVIAFFDHSADIQQRHDAAQGRHDRLIERLRDLSPRRTVTAADPQVLADLRRANAIIDQLTVPWDELFDAVQAADARGLGVLSLTPNARDRTVRLSGESRSMTDLLAYLDRMAAQPALSQVHLLGYNTLPRDGVPVLSFTLVATWRQRP